MWAVDKGAMQRKLPWRADVTCLTVIQTVEDAEDEHVTHHVVCGAADGAVKACAVEEDGTRRDRKVHGAGGGAVGMLRASEGGGERVLCVWESGRVVLWESKAWAPLFVYSHTAQVPCLRGCQTARLRGLGLGFGRFRGFGVEGLRG